MSDTRLKTSFMRKEKASIPTRETSNREHILIPRGSAAGGSLVKQPISRVGLLLLFLLRERLELPRSLADPLGGGNTELEETRENCRETAARGMSINALIDKARTL